MKIRLNVVLHTGSLALATVWLGAANLHSASGEKSTAGAHAAASNTIPQSVFVVPMSYAEGRDPFFPNSKPWTRGQAVVAQPTPTPTVSLVLNGLSGTPENRLAIINGRTFAQGETSELTIGGRRISVRCVEIREKSAVIEAGGRQQELFLRFE